MNKLRIEIIKKNYPNGNTEELAKALGWSESHLREMAAKLSIKRNAKRWRRWSSKEIAKLLTYKPLLANGEITYSEIGAVLNRSRWAIINYYRANK
jgi:hypothetical protein